MLMNKLQILHPGAGSCDVFPDWIKDGFVGVLEEDIDAPNGLGLPRLELVEKQAEDLIG